MLSRWLVTVCILKGTKGICYFYWIIFLKKKKKKPDTTAFDTEREK